MLIRCPAPAWLRIACGPRRLCSGARLRAHVSPTRQDLNARVLGARGPLMQHFSHLIELLRAVADFISGGYALGRHGPRARSRPTHITPPASPYSSTREGGPPASAGGRGWGAPWAYIYTRVLLIIYSPEKCEPPRSPYVGPMPGRRGSPRGPSGETLGAHNSYLSATQLVVIPMCTAPTLRPL